MSPSTPFDHRARPVLVMKSEVETETMPNDIGPQPIRGTPSDVRTEMRRRHLQ